MLTMEQLVGQKVFVPRPDGRRTKADGTPAPPKRIGKVHNLVFSPEGTSVVGLMVKRPDVAGMVKRDDLFVALDAVGTFEGGMLVDEAGTGDGAAEVRGLDLDRCIIWGGMDVATRSGRQLGYVTDVQFDYGTGAVDTVYVTDGAVAASMVGSVPVPGAMLGGYSKGVMVVADEAADLALTGGLAAKAGEGLAHARIAGKEAASKAGAAAGKAVDKGSFALGRALGSARRSIAEAMADDGSDDPLPSAAAEAVRVEAPAEPKAVPGEAGEPPLYAPAGTGDAPEAAGAGPAPKEEPGSGSAGNDTAARAAKAVGRQLGKTQGMFKSFLKEFEEASK